MALVVHVACDFILALRVGDDFFPLEPQLLRLVIGPGGELVVCGCGPQTAFFGTVGTIGVFAVLEVEANLVKALFGDKVVVLAQVAPIDDGVDELPRVRLEVATALDAPDALEAQGVPDAARCEVSFIDKVEDGICVALRGSEDNRYTHTH
jgi:hypothetical protein